jgi:hypothetical protein
VFTNFFHRNEFDFDAFYHVNGPIAAAKFNRSLPDSLSVQGFVVIARDFAYLVEAVGFYRFDPVLKISRNMLGNAYQVFSRLFRNRYPHNHVPYMYRRQVNKSNKRSPIRDRGVAVPAPIGIVQLEQGALTFMDDAVNGLFLPDGHLEHPGCGEALIRDTGTALFTDAREERLECADPNSEKRNSLFFSYFGSPSPLVKVLYSGKNFIARDKRNHSRKQSARRYFLPDFS